MPAPSISAYCMGNEPVVRSNIWKNASRLMAMASSSRAI